MDTFGAILIILAFLAAAVRYIMKPPEIKAEAFMTFAVILLITGLAFRGISYSQRQAQSASDERQDTSVAQFVHMPSDPDPELYLWDGKSCPREAEIRIVWNTETPVPLHCFLDLKPGDRIVLSVGKLRDVVPVAADGRLVPIWGWNNVAQINYSKFQFKGWENPAFGAMLLQGGKPKKLGAGRIVIEGSAMNLKRPWQNDGFEVEVERNYVWLVYNGVTTNRGRLWFNNKFFYDGDVSTSVLGAFDITVIRTNR